MRKKCDLSRHDAVVLDLVSRWCVSLNRCVPAASSPTRTAIENQGETMPTTATTDTLIPEFIETMRTQIVSAVTQSQKLTLDAAKSFAKATDSISVPEFSGVQVLPGVPTIETATKFTFDFATELLNSQRDFAIEFAKLLSPTA
jgi:hypothetical protein